jgi:hypothetical protein
MMSVEQEALRLQAQTARDLARRAKRQAERVTDAEDQKRLLSQAEELVNRAEQLEAKAMTL